MGFELHYFVTHALLSFSETARDEPCEIRCDDSVTHFPAVTLYLALVRLARAVQSAFPAKWDSTIQPPVDIYLHEGKFYRGPPLIYQRVRRKLKRASLPRGFISVTLLVRDHKHLNLIHTTCHSPM